MLPKNQGNDEFEKVVREIENFNNDTANWGERSWEGNIDSLSLWKWADSQNLVDMMSLISTVIATQIIVNTKHNFNDRIYKHWVNTFRDQATIAISNDQLQVRARFLEALLLMEVGTLNRIDTLNKLIVLYKRLRNHEKTAFFTIKKAESLLNLLKTNRFNSNENEICELLIEAYSISRSTMFFKASAFAFLLLGRYVAKKNKDRLALKILYQAKIFANKARTMFGVSIIEEMRKIIDKSNIPRSEYEIEIDPDILIEEFLREINI